MGIVPPLFRTRGRYDAGDDGSARVVQRREFFRATKALNLLDWDQGEKS
jgi:hypothetical protein